MNWSDLFWWGAVWNEIEGQQEDREWEQSQERHISQSHKSFTPAEHNKSKKDSRLMKLPIERMAELEKKLQVTIRGATANLNTEYGPQVAVRGELTAASGKINKDLRLIATVYNAADEVIGVGEICVSAQGFVGVEPFELTIICSDSHGSATQVRLLVRAY